MAQCLALLPDMKIAAASTEIHWIDAAAYASTFDCEFKFIFAERKRNIPGFRWFPGWIIFQWLPAEFP